MVERVEVLLKDIVWRYFLVKIYEMTRPRRNSFYDVTWSGLRDPSVPTVSQHNFLPNYVVNYFLSRLIYIINVNLRISL